MVTVDDVGRLALALPETVEGLCRSHRVWSVRRKVFAWERAFTQADLRRFDGASVPRGPIIGVRVADLGEKDAILAEGRPGFLTTAHFDGFAGLLIQLDDAERDQVREAVIDAWLATAPPRLAERHADELR